MGGRSEYFGGYGGFGGAAMIEVSIRFKRTFYQSLCPAPFQVDHANRYQLNF